MTINFYYFYYNSFSFCSVNIKIVTVYNIKVNDQGVLNNSLDLLSFDIVETKCIFCDCYFVSSKQFIAKE